MRPVLQLVTVLAMLLPALGQQIIDRVIVVVNGQVITQSDWDEQERFEALAEGQPPNDIQHSPAALERLIDRVLLLQQMAQLNFRPPAPELVQEELDSVRKQLPRAQTSTPEAWHHTWAAYGFPEEDFSRMVAERANVARFIDVRFRSNLRVAPFETENYYRDVFVPEFRKASPGRTPPPLKQVQDKIQQIVVEQRVNEQLNSFVQSLRSQAVIRRVTVITKK